MTTASTMPLVKSCSPSHGLTGGFNAKVGIDSYNTNKRVIGNHYYHSTTNDNAQRLIDLCESMDL